MSRSKTLDILRAVAVVLVLGRHMTVCPEDTSYFLNIFTILWHEGGWVGVDLFFVLSGFLISGLLFREHQKYGRISFKQFFIRRGLKIYPPFLLLILITVIERMATGAGFSPIKLMRELLFLQNYGPGLWGHTWSLGVEEHFYLFLPLLMILSLKIQASNRKPFAWIPVAFIAIAVACLCLRLYMVATVKPYDHYIHFFPTHLRMDSLFCGVAISYFYHYFPDRFQYFSTRYKWYLLPLAVLLFLPAPAYQLGTSPFILTNGLSLFWLGGGTLLFCLITTEPPSSPLVNAVAFVGSRSYSIYLWHMFVEAWGTKIIGDSLSWYYYFAFYIIGSILLGIAMAAIVEYPLLRFRDRLYPSRSQALATTV